MRTALKTGLLLTACALALGLTACRSAGEKVPSREDRMKSPQTARRGPAFKRLIITFNEAHSLAVLAADHAARLESEGADPDELLAARELADDAALFADDCEWFLANRRRMNWHQSYMNDLWVRYDELDESHRGTVVAYTDRQTRRPTRLLLLKREYEDRYGIERPERQWGDLFYPVGAKNYPGNPWEGESER